MGANIKQLKNRIRSVNSTMHITKAMELVASSKMRKAQLQLDAARPYSSAMGDVMERLSSCESIYTLERPEKKVLVISIAGDRGLAGGYNNDVFKALLEVRTSKEAVVLPIGKRMIDYLKGHNIAFENGYELVEKITLSDISKIGEEATKAYVSGEIDAVYILYTHYISMLSHVVTLDKILPIQKSEERECKEDILFEPNEEAVLNAAIPEYIAGKVYGAVSESFSSELSARRNAMDSASKNASAMIDELNLKYNRARQGAITQEITEIIGGAEAK